MQQQLISHSPDLARLLHEGFNVEVVDGPYLIIHRLPYVSPSKVIEYGSLVCALSLVSPARAGQPSDHTVYFCGEFPCDTTGRALTGLVNNSTRLELKPGLFVDHYLSSKPSSGIYLDYYEKMATYAKIIGSQAQALDPSVSWKNKDHEK